MAFIQIIIGVIVLAIITYFVIGYVYGKASITDTTPKEVSLSTHNNVYSSDLVKSNLLTQSGMSVMAFINYQFGDRTQQFAHSFNTLFGVKGSFELQVSPDATQLVVTTTGGSQPETETIELPRLEPQKWVFVAILRDGRRFDVLYNDRIVASKRLAYYPSIVQNPLTLGDKTFLGKGIHVLVAPYRLTPLEVSKQRAKLSDTNGEPPAVTTSKFGLPPIPFTGITAKCIPGLPCNPVTKPPKNHLKAWSTPYS